jgi:ADP-heptose:LPS heptosyltransferase
VSKTVCYFQSGIGNLVMATPALRAMASLDGSGKIHVLLDQKYRKDHRYGAVREMLENMPFVGRVLMFGEQNGSYERHFVPVQSEVSPGGHWVNKRTPKGDRWPGARWGAEDVHEIEANMRYVRHHGYRGEIPKQYVPVADWPVLSGPRPWIGLCNASFGSRVWEKKRWEWFPELKADLEGRFGGSCFGVGGPGDLAEVSFPFANFSGKTSITETAKVISQLDLFVTTDTGCMHIGDALEVPMIALFGATLTSKNAPVGRRSWFISSTLACAPCQYGMGFNTCIDYQCMRQIRPGKVVEAAEMLLGGKRWDSS